MERRREALGRNRQGPATRNTMPAAILLAALMVGGGVVAFRYFTEPQRVYGGKVLRCEATKITWVALDEVEDGYLIRGCGRAVRAVCSQTGCAELP